MTRRDGRRFDSIDKAADELVDALKLHRAAHPETKYWLLTNFPNWGWRGDVSYHARGPQRQDYGDYDQVVRIVLEKLRAAEIPLDGVTVDNPSWMRGWIEQRFPETIHSSLGLHCIDHRRPDMPPLSMLDPFPAWDRDEATGEISYAHKDRTGLVFSGRARPYEDQVVLEYRIRNEAGAKLHSISAQMCTNLGPSPDFDPKEDVTRTFTWVDGQWTSLADTTPNLAGHDAPRLAGTVAAVVA